ncbi:hypothetical protein CRE_31064 [Caenorhabditis remanei]|uniref:Uncharacterized protein n=1 Tax=Caenorhabditis remanei TaxID=31234 RepID=E3LUE8_CAERE|nr:hypothetical protein CRE_31064 [Caenorhabditis remanei]
MFHHFSLLAFPFYELILFNIPFTILTLFRLPSSISTSSLKMTILFSKMTTGNSPQTNGTALGVRIIGGSFLCLSIISSVIACALWNTENHTLGNNIFYYGKLFSRLQETFQYSKISVGLFATQMLNILIVYLMNRGITLQKAHYLQPFIICALLHLIICILLSAIFFLYVVTRATFYSVWSDLGFFFVFVILTGFWIIAISLAREYRDYVRVISFSHSELYNEEEEDIIYDDFLHETLPSFV